MSLREELSACIAGANHVAGTREDCDVARFLRDHGQALVEALADAERYRYLSDRVFYAPDRFRCIHLENLAVELRGKGGQSGGDLLTECIDQAIDLARTMAGSGGGNE
jgi:hypothetical protein